MRYRFAQFLLSSRRRVLLRDGVEQPLIPRYFDLLVFLIQHRHEAVHRRDIFDGVWRDAIVSDSALSQAIRTIRRTLGDDSREPRFIRTVSRHGYRFVFDEVIEEPDEDGWPAVSQQPAPEPEPTVPDPFEPLLERLTRTPAGAADEEDQREAAELLHALGTSEALERLGTRPGHADARAILRDTRWDVPTAGPVPLRNVPGGAAAAVHLVRIRLRRAARIVASRWAAASVGAGAAGALAGASGGVLIAIAPDGMAPLALAAVLAVIGGACGAAGGAGVGAGLAVAEAVSRSRRGLALVCGAAAGGGLIGAIVESLAEWSLATLVGLQVPSGGGLEGLGIGAAAGVGYALAAPRVDAGLAALRGRQRARAIALIAAACALAALMLTLAGRQLVGGTIHRIAQASQGASATLTPLGRLLGEPDFGPLARAVIGTGEGLVFGIGLAVGLTRRP